MIPYNQLDFSPHLLYECRFGSHVYGTAVADSDEDFRGIFAAPRAQVEAGLYTDAQINGPGDREVHELSRFLRLCAGQNAGFVELLWVPDRFVVHLDPAGQLLRAHRSGLLSARIGPAFSGLGRRLLADVKKRREKFLASNGASGAVRSARNRALEAACGYDAKTVATLVRLLRMAHEALLDGIVRVERPDAAELLALRQGNLPFAEAVALIEGEIRALAAAARVTDLPPSVDEEWLAALERRVYAAAWAGRTC